MGARYSPLGPAHGQEPLGGHGEGGADGAVVRDLHQRVQRRHRPREHSAVVAAVRDYHDCFYLVNLYSAIEYIYQLYMLMRKKYKKRTQNNC